MKHRGRLAILFVPALAIATVFILLNLMRQDEGPSFEGKTLYRWMQDLRPYTGRTSTVRGPVIVNGALANPARPPTRAYLRTSANGTRVWIAGPTNAPTQFASTSDAQRAIYEIGTNAIPYLVNYYLDKKKSTKKPLIPIEWHQKAWNLNKKYAPAFQIVPPILKFEHEYARAALIALNEKSVYALPVVLNLVKDGIMSSREEKEFYYFLVNHQNRIRSNISDQMVEEALVNISLNTAEFNSEQWILYLWTIQLRNVNAPSLIPSIESVLNHPNGMVQFQAIQSIGQFGAHAISSLPVLEPILDDVNYQAAFAAKKAIKQIEQSRAELSETP